MRERPVLFSAPMVRALLGGSKTQTRRVMREQICEPGIVRMAGPGYCEIVNEHGVSIPGFHCPYGKPGDRIWVRETWAAFDADWRHPGKPHDLRGGPWPNTVYQADGDFPIGLGRPSIHMPRWASRITLEITGVRVERLQDISEGDAYAEGVDNVLAAEAVGKSPLEMGVATQCGFAYLWDKIHGPGAWDANPWVWAVAFRRIKT